MGKKKVLGLGNALVDLIIHIDDQFLDQFGLPKGSMTLVDDIMSKSILEATKDQRLEIAAGGSASNTMDGLANLGVSCGYMGKIGTDTYGQIFFDTMKDHRIKPHLLYGEKATGTAITLLSDNAERTFATHLGSAVDLVPEDLDPQVFRNYDILHIEGYLVQNHELIKIAMQLARKSGMTISIDMASFNIVDQNRDFLKEVIKEYVDIVFANEEEAKSLTQSSPRDALDIIANWCDIAVVKIGKAGSWIKKGNDVFRIEGFPAKALDSTGTGDIYAAGFLFGLVNGKHLASCGKIGSYLGAQLVEIYGARLSDDRWINVHKFIESQT